MKYLIQYNVIVSELLLFSAKWIIFQLFRADNTLHIKTVYKDARDSL